MLQTLRASRARWKTKLLFGKTATEKRRLLHAFFGYYLYVNGEKKQI